MLADSDKAKRSAIRNGIRLLEERTFEDLVSWNLERLS